MLKPRGTKQFRRDLRACASDFDRLLKVTGAVHRLPSGERLPAEYKPHKLQGEYKDCWECHIENDLLLIWIPDNDSKSITFVRLGSHAELFG